MDTDFRVEKALSLTQPWATLVALGAKRMETRGWIAIHAAKGFPAPCRDLYYTAAFTSALLRHGYRSSNALPLGRVIAVVRITDCVRTAQIRDSLTQTERMFGDYSDGRYAIALADVRRLKVEVPASGKQRWWTLEKPITAADF